MFLMKFETDPVKIKNLSLAKEGENWGFRSFLKSCEIPEQRIDKTVQKLFKQVAKKIECCYCYNCCKEFEPVLKQDDVLRMSQGLKISVKELKKKYLVYVEKEDGFIFNQKPCPFFVDNACSVIDYRPRECDSYPFIYQNGFTKRLISVIRSSSVCPIVYNVLELLKEEIWGMDDSEFDPDSDDLEA